MSNPSDPSQETVRAVIAAVKGRIQSIAECGNRHGTCGSCDGMLFKIRKDLDALEAALVGRPCLDCGKPVEPPYDICEACEKANPEFLPAPPQESKP